MGNEPKCQGRPAPSKGGSVLPHDSSHLFPSNLAGVPREKRPTRTDTTSRGFHSFPGPKHRPSSTGRRIGRHPRSRRSVITQQMRRKSSSRITTGVRSWKSWRSDSRVGGRAWSACVRARRVPGFTWVELQKDWPNARGLCVCVVCYTTIYNSRVPIQSSQPLLVT